MARRRSTHLPAAKQRGQNSYVWHPVERQWVYLGRWGSQEAETRWRRMAAEYVRNPHSGVAKADGVLVAEIMAAYLEWLKLNDASPNVQDQDGRAAVALTIAYGDLPLDQFGPRELRTWAATLADPKLAAEYGWHRPRLDDRGDVALSRKTIKAFCSAVLRAIKWAIGNDMVKASETRIEDLSYTDVMAHVRAKPTKKRYPADAEDVAATMAELTPTLATAVAVIRLTGMRADEMLSMRPMDIRKSGEIRLKSGQRVRIEKETEDARKRGDIGPDDSVWFYIPGGGHKTEHHGIDRVVPILPAVQRLLEALPPRADDKPYISPKESTAQHRERQRSARKTKVQPSQIDRSKKKPKKSPTDKYESAQFRQAILRACDRAGVPRWTSHQLRHSALTDVVDMTGNIRAAQSLGDHGSPRTTESYVAKSMSGAVTAAAGLAKRMR